MLQSHRILHSIRISHFMLLQRFASVLYYYYKHHFHLRGLGAGSRLGFTPGSTIKTIHPQFSKSFELVDYLQNFRYFHQTVASLFCILLIDFPLYASSTLCLRLILFSFAFLGASFH